MTDEMAKKRRSNNPSGRPSHGLSEAAVIVRMPREQLDATDAAVSKELRRRGEAGDW